MSSLLLRDARRYGSASRHDIRIAGGRVTAIVPAGSRPALDDEVVELDGRFVGPGLWDEHVHFTQWVVRRSRLDLSAAGSAHATLDLIAGALRLRPPEAGSMLIGYGFRDALWPDAPTRRALDAVAGSAAVVLVSADLHCGWLSSAAARRLGVTLDDSGVLSERPWIDALHGMDHEKPQITEYAAAAADAARLGVVGIVDFENTDNATEWPERVAGGVISLRVEASVWPSRLDDAVARGLRTGLALVPGGLVTAGRLKVVVDGSLNTRTAWCWDPYPGMDLDLPHPCGVASVPPEELAGLLGKAARNGIQAAVHAIGDRANTAVVDTYERLGLTGTVEHAQLVRAADVARFARLGLVASVQPEHAMDDRDVADHHWAGRTDRAFAYGSLHRAGVVLRLGSDAPVAPLDPWAAIASATSRSRGDREVWHPEQRLPIDVALASSARGRTAVAEGDVADLVVLDEDPLRAGRDALRAMPVAGTLLAGRWTWRSGGLGGGGGLGG